MPWPATLPAIMVQGYSAAHQWNQLVTPMESGPQRRVRLSAHYLISGSGSMVLDKSQVADLYAVLDAAKDGADWIDGVPLDMGGGAKNHRARITALQIAVVVPRTTWQATVQWETDERIIA